jgi:putrescine transport system substrate-binding protein
VVYGGVAYDAKKVPPAAPRSESWGILFKPEDLKNFSKCGVGVLDSPEDLFAIASQYLWSDWRVVPAADRQTNLKRAFDLFSGILDGVKKYNSLAKGSMCLAIGYSMDSFRARDQAQEAQNGIEINYVIPKEGAPIFLDNLAIPKNAPHVDAAYAFIDFLLRPEIAAQNTNYLGVANGVLASKQFVDKKISGNMSVYPDAALMRRLFVPESNDSAMQKAITREWARVKIGK